MIKKNKAVKWNLARGESVWHWQQWGTMRTECGRLPAVNQETSEDPNQVQCKICRHSPSCSGARISQLAQTITSALDDAGLLPIPQKRLAEVSAIIRLKLHPELS